MNLIQFGATLAGAQQKQAAGAGGLGKLVGGAIGNAAKKPTVAVGRQLPAPPLPPPPPPRVKITPQDVANVPTPGKVTVSPAEAAAGRAKVTVTPQDVAGVPGKNYGSVPNKPITSSAAQSYFDNATSGGRQRMLGFDPQARPAPAPAPRSWADLSPEQQQSVHSFYTGGKSGSAKSFGAKVAASSCSYHDMPNSPTNKKHMTSASPAVLEADEASEAIKPKTTETKHDKSVVTGGKEARTKKAVLGAGTVIGALGGAATGKKGKRMLATGRGAVKGLGWDAGASIGGPMGFALGGLAGLPFGAPLLGAAAGGLTGGIGGGLLGKNVADSVIGPYETDEEKLERLLAMRDKMQSGPKKEAQASSGGYRAPTMVPDMSVTSGTGAVAAAPAAATHNTAPIRMPAPAVKPPAGKPGMFDGLKNIDARTALMYGLPIGLGGAGLYGLYNYLNSKPKKKTEDEKEKA